MAAVLGVVAQLLDVRGLEELAKDVGVCGRGCLCDEIGCCTS